MKLVREQQKIKINLYMKTKLVRESLDDSLIKPGDLDGSHIVSLPKDLTFSRYIDLSDTSIGSLPCGTTSKFNRNDVDEDMGGVGAPIATPINVPGVGNPTPGGVNQMGSGDKWSTSKRPYTQIASPRRKKKKLIEDNISPYDKIGMSMAKKMKVKPPFKKGKEAGNQNSVKTAKFEHEIISYDKFLSEEFKNNSNDEYRQKVLDFIDRPWQEEVEIEYVDLLDQYRDKFMTEPKFITQDYLRRMDKINGSKLALSASDVFLNRWENLLK